MPKKIVIVHIFKTGGTTIKYALRGRYGDKTLLDTTFRRERKYYGIIKLEKNTKIYMPNYESYDIIFGHFTYEKYKHLNRPMLTILREPISRFISHYSNNRTGKRPVSFRKFLKDSSNVMTHFTGGDLDQFAFVGILEKFDETMKAFSQMTQYNFSNPKYKNKTRHKIELSKNQIRLVEHYNQEDIELYKKALRRFNENIIVEPKPDKKI